MWQTANEIINAVKKINREQLFAIYHKTQKNPGASQIIMWQMYKNQQEILQIYSIPYIPPSSNY